MMVAEQSAEQHRLSTHLNGEHSKNRMPICNRCCSGWSQEKGHIGKRLLGARLPLKDSVKSIRPSGRRTECSREPEKSQPQERRGGRWWSPRH